MSQHLDSIILACRDILVNHPIAAQAREYLDARLPRNVQEDYSFGFFPPDNQLSLLNIDLLKEAKIVYPKYIAGGQINHGHFNQHNLILPFKNVYGKTVSIVGRTLLSEEEQKKHCLSKYKYSLNANKQLYLYGIERAKKSIVELNYVILVEGQFDVITAQSNDVHNVVACGGADLLPFQFFLLRRYTNNIILLFDNDVAGKKAKKKVKKRYSNYANIKTMSPPEEFKDIDEFLRKSSPEKRKEITYKLNNLLNKTY